MRLDLYLKLTRLVKRRTIAQEMVAAGETGAIVTLLCDDGDRYASTCFDDGWMEAQGHCLKGKTDRLAHFLPLQA